MNQHLLDGAKTELKPGHKRTKRNQLQKSRGCLALGEPAIPSSGKTTS